MHRKKSYFTTMAKAKPGGAVDFTGPSHASCPRQGGWRGAQPPAPALGPGSARPPALAEPGTRGQAALRRADGHDLESGGRRGHIGGREDGLTEEAAGRWSGNRGGEAGGRGDGRMAVRRRGGAQTHTETAGEKERERELRKERKKGGH